MYVLCYIFQTHFMKVTLSPPFFISRQHLLTMGYKQPFYRMFIMNVELIFTLTNLYGHKNGYHPAFEDTILNRRKLQSRQFQL